MREIKFRGKSVKKLGYKEEGSWFFGGLITSEDKNDYQIAILDEDKLTWRNIPIDKKTISQYTGLKDQEGKEVYEGDIFVKMVSYLDLNSGETYFDKEYCVVEFIDGCFKVYEKGYGYHELKDVINKKEYDYDKWDTGIVFGNIYENKELLGD